MAEDAVARIFTPSFVAETPLVVSNNVACRIDKALRAHGNLYNACLGEARRRAIRMRQHPAWQTAKQLPKKTDDDKKARQQAFLNCRKRFSFSKNDLQKFAKQTRDACWLNDHIGGADLQVTCDRAFNAVEQWVFGLRGKPRFKRTAHFRCIRGKSNQATIRLRQSEAGVWQVHWRRMVMPMQVQCRANDTWQAEALTMPVKYVSIVRKTVRGKQRYFAQVVHQGFSPTKARHTVGQGIVGIDLGPRTVAVVGPEDAGKAGVFKEMLCPGTEGPRDKKRRLSRKLDRSRRATNPDNYDAEGCAKRGCKWVKSHSYKRTLAKMAEAERVLVATRKTEHGTLINRILALGIDLKLEKLSYLAWQKCFGRSVGNHAPGRFVTKLVSKAESAGGKVMMIPTRSTKLSQYDHKSKTYTPKPLQQREHQFADGTKVDRDIYSAWLACFVEDGTLSTIQLEKSWAAMRTWLEGLAVPKTKPKQPMSAKGLPKARSRSKRPQNRSPGQGAMPQCRGHRGAMQVATVERSAVGNTCNPAPLGAGVRT